MRRCDLLCLARDCWGDACDATRELMARFANGSNVLYLEPPSFEARLPELIVVQRAGRLVTATMRLPPELAARERERERTQTARRLLLAYLERPRATVIWVTAPELLGCVEGVAVDVLVYQRTGDAPEEADASLFARADLVLDRLESAGSERARTERDPRVEELPGRGAHARTWDHAWRTLADRLDRLVAVDRQAAA